MLKLLYFGSNLSLNQKELLEKAFFHIKNHTLFEDFFGDS